MTVFTWIILFTILGGMLSVLGASLVLFLPKKIITRMLPFSVSFATGALLSVSFVGLIPHALEEVGHENFHTLSITILGGLMFFFALVCYFFLCFLALDPEAKQLNSQRRAQRVAATRWFRKW